MTLGVCVFLCFYSPRFWNVFKISGYKTQLLSDCILFKWTNKKKHRALNKIDVGTKVKCLFAELDLLPSEKQNKIQENCLKFYVNSGSYLQSQLPFDNSFMKHFQYAHPKKRLDPRNIIAISNIALNIGRVIKTVNSLCIPSETIEGWYDSIRTQWRVYQTKLISEDWYKNRSEESAPSSSRTQHSYW